MPERSDRHGWIDLLVPDGPFLSAAALDVQTVGENWPTRLSAEQRSLLTAPPASEAEEGEGWDDSSWDGRRARVSELLTELLGYREGKSLAVAPGIAAHHHIYRARVSADFAIHAPGDPGDVRMVVICGPHATDDPARLDPTRTHAHDGWVSTPVQRAALLARQTDADLALVTNGREHLLVSVVTGTTGSAMWTVNGLEDRQARDAFVALLHKQRVLHRTVSLSKLIELSQDRQHELTDTLGKQVRRAAEAMVNAISRANRTSRGRLLEGLTGQQVYTATTRVLMRTVFLLVAEERGLLPVAENQLYTDQYAMSTLLDKLDEDAYRNRSAMERRAGAWQRMMALSRAVHAGIEHDALRLPAYGGNLFDPDEHPFLEARVTAADGEGFEQLDVGVVDDFTVLTVLRHLQIADGQRISFRSLDVEQIGHVYEALLDHSAVIVPDDQVAVLGLIGKAGNEPEVSLIELEAWTAKSDKELGKQLIDLGVAAEAKGLYQTIDDGLAPDSEVAQTLNVAVANDPALRERVERYAPLLRTDARGIALVFRPGDVYVTETSSKRDSGTAYTPRILAEEIAKHALDPLIYDPGPHNEPDVSKWKLKAPDQILDLKICDPAVGSAAILVGAVRYLAEALLQARVEGGELSAEALASGATDIESVDARVQARRAIVARCVYGVDRDPMAVEMAKLSLWLITMARDEPFSFLDHAIRCGDSLLGVTSLDQLRRLHLDRDTDLFGFDGGGLFADEAVYEWRSAIDSAIEDSRRLRRMLRQVEVRDVTDAEEQARLHNKAQQASRALSTVADAVTAACLASATGRANDAASMLAGLTGDVTSLEDPQSLRRLSARATEWARRARPTSAQGGPRYLHWPLEFPEVWDGDRRGFDAMVANPPFLGGRRISTALGQHFRDHILRYRGGGNNGTADLCAYFFRLASTCARSNGFLATNSISQSDSRIAALREPIEDGSLVYRAEASVPWPGDAAVTISKVWMTRQEWSAACLLDGQVVEQIASDLYPGSEAAANPRSISERAGIVSAGPFVLGRGFVVPKQLASDWIRQDPRNADVLAPYVNGQTLNSAQVFDPPEWIIDFHGWSKEKAQTYEAPFAHVEEHVRPERAKNKIDYRREKWWLYASRNEKLLRRLDPLEHCIGVARVSSRVVPLRVPTRYFLSDQVAVFPYDSWHLYGLITSTIHRVWVDRYASTMKSDIRYTPPDVFDTFPLSDKTAEVCDVMSRLHEYREGVMLRDKVGVTSLYRGYHDPKCATDDVVRLRAMHRDLDGAVLGSYGFDIPLEHGFHATRYGTFYVVSEAARFRLLEGLLALNREQGAPA